MLSLSHPILAILRSFLLRIQPAVVLFKKKKSQFLLLFLINASISCDINRIFSFQVKNSKSSYLEFEVVVTDVNDNTPVFKPTKYAITLMEDLPRGAYVTSLHAVDPDQGLHGLIRYRLIGKVSLACRLKSLVKWPVYLKASQKLL